ncbi:glycosyltransferase [Roseomonas terrae]|jgi:glycosyltransferase involved in cell wall biosynthesis|uniref:Glycosyltransferase n=1 Tax=Neoroseomonas terrae TaxID=424799 RepID=A0ABS5EMI6_9PROT|nr:glycosyltransferase [Neoroseomonas terrae]MBR0652241.1 glycosyltransferase [Neoroseomonas terrae]
MDQPGGDGSTTPGEALRQADSLRDERMWDAAVLAYRGYLERRPEDWRARVQLGHCLKESGDLAAALAAYREAATAAPNSADAHLHVGHALTMLGEGEGAWRAYARALELEPDNADAARGARSLSSLASAVAVRARAPGQAQQIVFDSSDLVAYVMHNRTPTGIQRVQLNVTARALLDPIEGAATSAVAFDEVSGFWREIGRDLFLRLWRLSRTGGEVDAPAWIEVVSELRATLRDGPDFAFAPGASLVNLGTSWWIRDYFLRVRHIMRRYGVRYVPLVYDCIPLMTPEHCQPLLVEEFAQWFSSMAAQADSALAISEWSAADARRIAAEVLPERTLPVTVVRLDADLRRELGAAASEGWPPRPDLPEPNESFVLCVGTIESRKNHLMLFHAWLALIRRHGAARVPRLVCIGKPGWLADGAMTLWRNSEALRERVSIAHGVPDVALAALYSRAMFTVTNSFYEGWGLPVTESLSFGRVPLVARNTSLTEAGGEVAVYFEPENLPDLVAKLEGLIFNADERERREAAIRDTVTLRSWGDIADQVMREVAARAAEARDAPRAAVLVEPAVVYPLRLTGGSDAARSKAMADLLRDGLAWYPLEAWGCWTRAGLAKLRLPVDPAATEGRLRLYLGCVATAGAKGIRLRAFGIDSAPGPFLQIGAGAEAGGAFACVLECDAVGGEVIVEIDSGAGVLIDVTENDVGRAIGLGVTSVMLCRADDLLARLEFLERQAYRVLGAA